MESIRRVTKKNTLLQTQNSDLSVDVLKVDKDLFIPKDWIPHYVANMVQTCKIYSLTVLTIKMTYSRKKGMHLYIKIHRKIEAERANKIQFLLGDDPKRVVFNNARIKSGCPEWNKLFEEVARRLITIYEVTDYEVKVHAE